MDSIPSSSVQQSRSLNKHLRYPKLAMNPFQKIQVERFRLNFFLTCRGIKRPPPSLRCSGINVFEEEERIQLISKFETVVLNKAIEKKKKAIKTMETSLKNSSEVYMPLSKSKKKKWRSHFSRKIQFYKKKELTEWKLWPKKSAKVNERKEENKKRNRAVRNLRRREKKMKKTAEKMIADGDVRVLINVEVPPEAIVILGKGLGFVPTPNPDSIEARLDARRVTNKITYHANRCSQIEESQDDATQLNTSLDDTVEEEASEDHFTLPRSLNQASYFQAHLKSTDPEYVSALQYINTQTNGITNNSKKKRIKNLSLLEEKGLNWLKNEAAKNNLCVCKADKGGAILLVPPSVLTQKIEEKVMNTDLYEKLENDPRRKISDDLFDKWKNGVSNGFVSSVEAKKVVGLTENGNKSTASRFKYGRTYFNPSLKIHKMKTEDLKPGCNIPARIITCLQESVTKRSDVFLAEKWLKDLELDFCGDLLRDTTDTLIWLEKLNGNAKKSKRHFNPFSFDFESLYDSLTRDLLFEALQDAMDNCRLSWSAQFKAWLKELVKLSVESSFGEYRGSFYKPKEGCPTGGSLSVQIANISVFYVLKKVLYEDKDLMKDIVDVKRFIDDGVGLHCMTSRNFAKWKNIVSDRVGNYGLKIKQSDWSEPENKHGMINFLDIKFSFDKNKSLQTDLYRKPTDARSYLNFNSCHPPYTFSGVVFSQATRLRRIINNDDRLNIQLQNLKEDFLKCDYPSGMLDNIIKKVKILPRTLEKKRKKPHQTIKYVSSALLEEMINS